MTATDSPAVPFMRARIHPAILALCVIEAVLLGLFGAASGAYGLLFGFVTDSCGGYHCDFGVITAGTFVTIIGCAAAAIAFDLITIKRVRAGRSLAWLFPLIGAVLVIVFFWGGYIIVMLGAHLPLDGSGRPA